MESRPGKRPRTSAMAQSVPSTSEMAVDSAAICTEVASAGHRPRVLGNWLYQRMDQAGGGRVKTAEEPKDTATVTTSGVIRKMMAKIAKTQTRAEATRSVAVIASLRGASPATTRRRRWTRP